MALKKRKVKKAARADKKRTLKAAKLYKSGAKQYARGKKQSQKADVASSKATSKQKSKGKLGGQLVGADKKSRMKSLDAGVKMASGSRRMAAGAAKKGAAKKKSKLYRTVPASGLGKNKYVLKSGKTATRKKRR